MPQTAPRYAIYYTPPPLTPLAAFGAAVLGYDSFGKSDVPRLRIDGVSPAELAAATEKPRRYGCHATLVAPFHLGRAPESALLEALDDFCSRMRPVSLGALRVTMMGDFIALRPTAASAALAELARHCVEFFDAFRAPLTARDRARRDNGRLSPRQREHLLRWGYPYIFEDFRFHMTLTDALGGIDRVRFHAALSEAYRPQTDHVIEIDGLSLMRQPSPEAAFGVVARKTFPPASG